MKEKLILRPPEATDGMALFDLVARCSPLDTNSSYCNLLQVSHFSDTAVVANRASQLVGSVTGYRLPNSTSPTWFVWQVAVDDSARGLGLAKQMLLDVLARPHMADIEYIETTITRDNEASWALFRSLARQLQASLSESVMFEQQAHFQGRHATEYLVRIGPLTL
ncbi:diaminobutyrate acetyltransferase [Marinomonas ostreistagni]|uniref:diaminobutyrate acetyltransferase n=1 Tax=Marinomonas ostreistagni TaxID=359209 RepID=UPI0030841CC3